MLRPPRASHTFTDVSRTVLRFHSCVLCSRKSIHCGSDVYEGGRLQRCFPRLMQSFLALTSRAPWMFVCFRFNSSSTKNLSKRRIGSVYVLVTSMPSER